MKRPLRGGWGLAVGLPVVFALSTGPVAAEDVIELDTTRTPTRCQAVFIGPREPCEMSGKWGAAGTGKTPAKAAEAAQARLERVVAAAMVERLTRIAGDGATLVGPGAAGLNCVAAAAEHAHFSCESDPALAPARTCFVTLLDRSCWTGGALSVDGPGWRAMEKGRDELCSAVSLELETKGVSAAERARCQLACLQETKASCPAP